MVVFGLEQNTTPQKIAFSLVFVALICAVPMMAWLFHTAVKETALEKKHIQHAEAMER